MPALSTSGETSPEIIAQGLNDWLRAEVVASMATGNANAHLNELDDIRRRWALPHDDPDNYIANKTYDHLNRVALWWMDFQDEPQNDFLAARVLFMATMHLSGEYRRQCYMQAADEADYLSRRAAVIPIGIHVGQVVCGRLIERFGNIPKPDGFRDANLGLPELQDELKTNIRFSESALKFLCRRAHEGEDFGKNESQSTIMLKAMQLAWVNFVTDLIIYDAKTRHGQLARVPMLQPVSITDQPENPIHHPFQARV